MHAHGTTLAWTMSLCLMGLAKAIVSSFYIKENEKICLYAYDDMHIGVFMAKGGAG